MVRIQWSIYAHPDSLGKDYSLGLLLMPDFYSETNLDTKLHWLDLIIFRPPFPLIGERKALFDPVQFIQLLYHQNKVKFLDKEQYPD